MWDGQVQHDLTLDPVGLGGENEWGEAASASPSAPYGVAFATALVRCRSSRSVYQQGRSPLDSHQGGCPITGRVKRVRASPTASG